MTTSPQSLRIRWKIALAAVPVVLLLAGCRQTASYDIHADDTVTVEYDQGMTQDEVAAYAEEAGADGGTLPKTGKEVCDNMKSEDGELDKGVTYTPYENKGGMFGCVAKGDVPLTEIDDTITRDGDVFTFSLDNTSEAGAEADVPDEAKNGDFSITVTFPGKVLSHEGGTVKGNSVVWSGYDEVRSKLEATGSAKPSSPIMLILLIVGGVVIVGAVVALIVVVTRKSKKKPPTGGYPGQYPGQYPQQGQPGQQFPGQYPQQGQPGQQFPGQYPQQGQPGQQFPGQYPQQGQQFPGQYPQQGQPGQQFPGQYPQQGQPGQQYPQQGQPGQQYPQQGQPGQQYPGQQYPQQGQ